MFINPSALKKQIKAEYNAMGIQIGYLEDGIVVIGKSFSIWFDYERVPNSIKSIIVEFLGQIPEKHDHIMSVSKDKPFPQMVMKTTYEPPQSFAKIDAIKSDRTRLTYDCGYTAYEMFQNRDTKEIFGIESELYDLFDASKRDTDNGETYPDGPRVSFDNTSVSWKNEASVLVIFASRFSNVELGKKLKEIDFAPKEER